MSYKMKIKFLKKQSEFIDDLTLSLKYMGLWNLDSKSSRFFKLSYSLYKYTVVLVLLILATTVTADIYYNIDDVAIATDDGCICAGLLIVIYNVISFELRRDRIERLIKTAFITGEDLFKSCGGRYTHISKTYCFYEKFIHDSLIVVAILLIIALMFFAPTEEGNLPIRARYPFDTTKPPWHQIGFLLQGWAVSFGIISVLQTQAIIINMFYQILLQFKVLSLNFENCAIDSTTNQQKEKFVVVFKKYTKHHQRLIDIITEFNKLFNTGFFVLMVSSTLMICLTSFQFALVAKEGSSIFKFGIYLSCATTQLFYFCWLGNEVMTRNSTIVHGQWLSNWELECLRDVSDLLNFSNMFSNKPLNIQAGKFFNLCIATFITIIKHSYSLFALLSETLKRTNEN